MIALGRFIFTMYAYYYHRFPPVLCPPGIRPMREAVRSVTDGRVIIQLERDWSCQLQ